MRLIQTFPGETVQSIQDATGFELLVAPNVTEFAVPTVEEIRLIREVVDPDGIFVKRVAK